MNYKISEVAEKTALTTYTLRYYEKEGLLWDVHRGENGQRYYTERDIEMIEVIDCLKKTGMSIEDIKKYIAIFRHDISNADERVLLFEKQREVILQKMEEFRQNLEMADYKIWYYQNIGKLVDEKDPLHCQKMKALYKKRDQGSLIDITLKITPKMVTDAQRNEKKALVGHLGTHFDVMDQEFPLEYTRRAGIVFDVSGVSGRDIGPEDIDLNAVKPDMFVAFHTGYIEKVGYGSKEYFSSHPALSVELINKLLEKGVSIIGVDCAGVRNGKEHTPMDQYCADHGVFIVENLCNLKTVLGKGGTCIIRTYPMNYAEMTGLPCRVVAEI